MSATKKPPTEMVRALDVKPYEWAIWSSIENGEPFANTITMASWSEDGESIWFMLDSFNFYKAKPDDLIELVRETPTMGVETLAEAHRRHAEDMAKRPTRHSVTCPTCSGEGKVTRRDL